MPERPSTLLTQHAPTPPDGSPELDAIWRSVEHSRGITATGRRSVRIAASGLALAAATAAILVVPGLTRPGTVPAQSGTASAAVPSPATSSSPQTTDLQLLATKAAAGVDTTIPEGKYLHLRIKMVNSGEHTATGKGYVLQWDEYYANDGTLWMYEADDPDPKPYWKVHSAANRARIYATPAAIATWPTDPQDLIAAVRPAAYRAYEAETETKVAGEVDGNIVLSQYLMQALSYDYAPAKVRSAMIGALEELKSVSTSTRKSHSGKTCTSVNLARDGKIFGYWCFDKATSILVEQGRDGSYITMPVREILDALPAGAATAVKKD